MKNYKPSFPFNVYMQLLIPTETTVKGVPRKTYSGDLFFYGSFRTYGGTEGMVNDVYTIVNTATVDTWYRPEIKANCKIRIINSDTDITDLKSGGTYDIISDPENINQRNQFLQFKVKKVGA